VWLVYLEGPGASLHEGGAAPVVIGAAVPLGFAPLHIHRSDERGVPRELITCRRLALDDPAVSWGARTGHCRVWVEGGQVWVEDFGSDNGTWVERAGGWLAVQRVAVQPGERLRVGRSLFVLREEPGAASACLPRPEVVE